MPEFSLAALPEVFVSDSAISKAVYDAVERGKLRKLGSRLYTRNLDEDPERLIRRNCYGLIASYYPDAVIADRTALENKPAQDGSVFLISAKRREVALPGLTFRPRVGPPPIDSDRQRSTVQRRKARLHSPRLSRKTEGIARTGRTDAAHTIA